MATIEEVQTKSKSRDPNQIEFLQVNFHLQSSAFNHTS